MQLVLISFTIPVYFTWKQGEKILKKKNKNLQSQCPIA